VTAKKPPQNAYKSLKIALLIKKMTNLPLLWWQKKQIVMDHNFFKIKNKKVGKVKSYLKHDFFNSKIPIFIIFF